MLSLPILLAMLLLRFPAARANLQVVWKTDPVLVFLHRSANMVAPENTVPALEGAVKQGADGIEIDVRRTRDGVFVLYHDDWVLRQYGTTGKIENLTLAETQQIDIGERFGVSWKGLHPPLFEDVLKFARANSLRLFFDIKTSGIYPEVLAITRQLSCFDLIHTTGGQVPKENLTSSVPWIRGWNYTDNGEEDPERMQKVLTPIPTESLGIMCDDARSIVRALGRHPEKRPFTPFVSTMQTRLKTLKAVSISNEGLLSQASALLKQAEFDPDFTVRQDACWKLARIPLRRKVPSSTLIPDTLLRIALAPLNAEKQKAGNYEDTFLKIAAACALVRLQSDTGRAALQKLKDSPGAFDREATAFALGAFGTEKDIPALCALVDADPRNNGTVSSVIMYEMGRLGVKALPVYKAALSREDVSKFTVFGLAALGAKSLPLLEATILDTKLPGPARRRAVLALYWNAHPAAEHCRKKLSGLPDLPVEWKSLLRK